MFNTPWELIKDIRDRNLGDTCFIIGGGPSLSTTLPNPSILDGKPVITTNNAYKLFTKPLLCHFSDSTWYYWWKKEIHESIKNGKVFTTASHTKGVKTDITYRRAGIHEFGCDLRSGGISIQPGQVNGNNAGHQAINLAVHCMFPNIILLGFDMDPKSKETHWHREHRRDTNRHTYNGTMIPGMEKIAKEQEKLNFKVYNANRASNLKCFEFTDLAQWL